MEKPLPEQASDRPYVFVSYAHEDAATVYPEIQRLRGEGFNIWYDEGISPGARWSDELAMSLTHAGLFLYFVSPHSVGSPHCQDEANLALDAGKPVIAVYLEPTELTPGLRLRLSSHQAILKYELSAKDYRDKLSAAVSRHIQQGQADGSRVHRESVSVRRIRPAIVAGGLLLIALLIGALVMLNPGFIREEQVTAPVEPATPASPTEPAAALPAKPSIAVLPFANMSDDPDQEYFSDGMADDILNALVQHTEMKVIARTSSFQFKGQHLDIREIGEKLGVTHVLEGSVRKAGNRVRVTAQLNNTEDGAHLWSDQYDRELTDIFAVQDDITRRIVQALNAELVGDRDLTPATDNVEAHNAYLLSLHHNSRGQFEQAIEALDKAIALDPDYVRPYVGLAYAHINMASGGLAPWAETVRISRSLYEKARTLAPEDWSVRLLGAWHQAYVDRRYQPALNTYWDVCQACNGSGSLLRHLRRFEAAIRVYDRALEVNPLSPLLFGNKGYALLWAGRFNEALDAFEMQESLGARVPYARALAAALRQDIPSLRAAIAQGDWSTIAPSVLTLYQARLAYAEGDAQALETALDRLAGTQFQLTRVTASLLRQDLDEALTIFEKMASTPGTDIYFTANLARVSPLYREFSQHPRFHAALQDVGLDDASLSRLKIPPLPEMEKP